MTTIAELMTAQVDLVALDATLGDAARCMLAGKISSVIVVDRDKAVIGIVTERDMLHAMRQHQGHAQSVVTAMTSPVHTVVADLDYREAFRLAARQGIRHLVVCDAQRHPLGVVTEGDFRRHLGLDFFRQMNTVDVLMDRVFPRLAATALLDEALAAMEAVRGSCVVVVEGRRPLGIVTERDVVRLYLTHEGNPTLAEVMTQPVACVHVDTPLAEAAERMLVSRIRHLAVLDDAEHLVGLLTEHSLVRPLELDLLDDALNERLQLSATHASDVRKMARNERYQQALLDNFPFLVWLKDTESRFLAVNRPFAEAAGQATVSFFPGKSDLDVWPVDLAQAYRADDFAVMASGQAKSVIEPVMDQGVRHWFETYKAPVLGDDGSLLGTVGFSRDVSERKREEEASLIRSAALAGLLRGEPLAGVLELLLLSLETEMQGGFGLVFRFAASAGNLQLIAAPSAPEKWRDAIATMRVGEGCGCSGTAAFRRTKVFVENVAADPLAAPYREFANLSGVASIFAQPVLSTEGELLGVFTVCFPQTWQSNRRQEGLLTQCGQLVALILGQQSNQRFLENTLSTFRGIFDSVSDALLVLDVAGLVIDANAAAAGLSGRSVGQLLGLSNHCLLAAGLNDLALVDQQLAAAIAGQPACIELWGQNVGGHIFPVEVNLRPGQYQGRAVAIVSVKDISERQAAEQRLQIEHDLAEALASGMPRDEVLETLLAIALRFPEFDCGGLYLVQPDGSFKLAVHRGLSEAFLAQNRDCAVDSPQAQIIRAGEVVCSCTDTGQCCTDFELIHNAQLVAEGLLCLAVLPVLIAGEPVASLYLASRKVRQVTQGTHRVLKNLRQHFAHTLMRLEAQEAEVMLQNNLSGMFDALKDFLLIVDAQGVILHTNRALTEVLGYGEDELKGMPVLSVHPEKNREMAARFFAEMLAGERDSCPLPLLRKDGSELMVETRVVSGFWDGEPALFGVSRDISERLLAEERQKLAASVFENAHEGIMITDPQGRIIEVNPTFTELTGYTRDEVLGQTTALLRSGHHPPAFYAAMWQTIASDGFWRGEVRNRKKNGEIIDELLTISSVRDRSGEVSHFVGIFSDITAVKEHQQRLEHLAHFDPLTQLPNRMLLADRLQLAMAQAARSGKALALAYLDLDGFKPVNDEFGHAIGDRLLVEVAQRLRQCMRAGDTAARLGGDEFVLLFSGLEDEHECDSALSRVLAALASPFHLAGKDIGISASIGVTLYPQDNADADTLLRHADQAMYLAKQGGRNRFHLFDPESDRRTRIWHEDLARIRQAFEQDEFVLYYQPKVNMREGRVLGAEALIRWRHPERGLLLPGGFLPTIRGSDLEVYLGKWVLRTALQQLATWQAAGFVMSLSVNISGTHLQSPGFVPYLADLLAEFPTVSPALLELEILETAVLEDMAQAAEIFAACRKLGVTFALDDFGTGYSSLTYFRRLPAEMLKIDQSFVRDMLEDPEDLAIVEGIIGLTQAFQRKVIAEGVETAEHGMLLLQLGCELAQGFGIARPMPADDLPAWTVAFRPDQLWSAIATFRWAREDLPMLLAEGDHRRWLQMLDDYLANPSESTLLVPLDPALCRFGRWYYGAARKRYGRFDSYQAIEAIHQALHELGKQLLALRLQHADPALVARCREELGELSNRLIESVQSLQAEVLVFGMG